MSETVIPFGQQLPQLHTPLPGAHSQRLIDQLARHESPSVTARRARRAQAIGAAAQDPVVWAEALGSNVRDADGNVLVDMTAGFAVALLGHRDPRVVQAVQSQATRLLHAMGDAFPDTTRIAWLAALARRAPQDAHGQPLEVAIPGLSGSDAIDIALRTARLATGRDAVLVFEGSYHGLALGVLGLQSYKATFTDPFRGITHPRVHVLPWACPMAEVRALLGRHPTGLVLVEPLQGRGGMRPAPDGWLAELRQVAHDHGALLGVDEIQSGLGRTGAWWRAPAEGCAPDLLCTGKALGGGLPLSACVGSREVMNAWGASQGEAIATQTFLGHPLGCAASLASLRALNEDDMPTLAAERGDQLTSALHDAGFSTRGHGLMIGVHTGADNLRVMRDLLVRGWIVLPAGASAEVLGLTPPATLSDTQIEGFVQALVEVTA